MVLVQHSADEVILDHSPLAMAGMQSRIPRRRIHWVYFGSKTTGTFFEPLRGTDRSGLFATKEDSERISTSNHLTSTGARSMYDGEMPQGTLEGSTGA